MGLKHLVKVEELFKKHPERHFSKAELYRETGMNYNTLLDVLAHLIKEKKITKTKEKFKWKN